MINPHRYCVIMCGGIGSRFWPYSRTDRPKQFLDFLGTGRTLLQMSYDRVLSLVEPEHIIIVTNAQYASLVKEQLPDVNEKHILLEPVRRNTAPCIAWAAWHIAAIDPEASMIVTPSDHLITREREFEAAISSGFEFVENHDALLTLGINPTRPETGYGYIEAVLGSSTLSNKEIFRVDSFKEKPSLDIAEAYVAKNNFYWNAGIFIWNVSTIVNAFRIYQSPIASVFEALSKYFFTPEEQAMVNERFPECRNISVDYAIMERADEIFVFPADFGWSDLGTWMSLHENRQRDLNSNVVIGTDTCFSETRNCIVCTQGMKKVVVIGMENCIVAEKDNNLLVCRMGEEERIKEFAD